MSQRFHLVRATLVWARRLAFLAVLLSGADHQAWAQTMSPGPFIQQDTLGFAGTVDVRGPRLAVAGDTAIAASVGTVSVYERDTTTGLWAHVTDLSPDDGAANFGRAVSFDGRRAIVAATDAAYVFRRQPGGAHNWHQVARLVASDGPALFGADVAIDGRYAIVGTGGASNAAFVFKRTPAGWEEIRKLAPPPNSVGFGFGGDVDISGDSAIVGAGTPTSGRAFIFGRDQGGRDNWGLVKDLGATLTPTAVAIDDDTAAIGGGEMFPTLRIFGRNEGGSDAWGLQAEFGGASPEPERVCCGTVVSVSVSGDYVIAGTLPFPSNTNVIQIRARNQGGPDAWGLVSRFSGTAQPPAVSLYSSVAIDGDTALLDTDFGPANDTVSVWVSDIDGDGMPDAVDPCRRDPLNNVAGGCQRSSGASPVLDDLLAQTDVTTETLGQRLLITATFTNTSTTAVKNPFFEVTELTGGNVLRNADGGPGGVGATLSPDVGDGILSPGESMRVTFRIRLQSQEPFGFFVQLHGDQVP
jgi:hypothetical protein